MKCDECRAGRYNFCHDMYFMGTPPWDGCMCEYVAWPEFLTYQMPEEMSWQEGQRLKLEHISSSVPAGMNHGFNYTALFGDYTIPGTSLPIGYILSAITAILIFFLISKVLMAVYGSTNKAPNK